MKALLLNGQSHHGWLASSPLVTKILEQTGLFSVDVMTRGPKGSDMTGFRPEFDGYDLVVLDDGGDPWSEPTNEAFLMYMESGGGVALFHHSCQLFPQWPEFNEIMGVGGWGRRTEKAGPRLYWRDGTVVRDGGPGNAGDHIDWLENQVITRDGGHPITRGLPEKWLHTSDELYFNLRGPAKNLDVLATAYVDPSVESHSGHGSGGKRAGADGYQLSKRPVFPYDPWARGRRRASRSSTGCHGVRRLYRDVPARLRMGCERRRDAGRARGLPNEERGVYP